MKCQCQQWHKYVGDWEELLQMQLSGTAGREPGAEQGGDKNQSQVLTNGLWSGFLGGWSGCGTLDVVLVRLFETMYWLRLYKETWLLNLFIIHGIKQNIFLHFYQFWGEITGGRNTKTLIRGTGRIKAAHLKQWWSADLGLWYVGLYKPKIMRSKLW